MSEKTITYPEVLQATRLPEKGLVELAYEARIDVLERLLKNLLKEVSMLDAMGLVNQFVCTGCVKKNPKAPKACVEARKYLDE